LDPPVEPTLETLSLDKLAMEPFPILVDCTDGIAENSEFLYTEAMNRGIHVVATSARSLQHLSQSFVSSHVCWPASSVGGSFSCASTVGGSVPIITTVQSLIRTGDPVLQVEAGLSGSMNYATNQIANGLPIAEALRDAYQKRHTERVLHEDLLGLDMARRLVVLGQQLGHHIDLSQVDCEPLFAVKLPELPQTCQTLSSQDVEALFKVLGDYQSKFEELSAANAGRRLRYVGRLFVEADGKLKCQVKPEWLEPDHEMFTMRGTELYVAFTTKRMQRVMMQGAGQGGVGGAAGVFNDVLRIATRLRSSQHVDK